MYRAVQSRSFSRALFGAAIAALASAAALSPQLAIIFSPLLVLVALYSFDQRVYETLVELVAALGGVTPRAPRSTPLPRALSVAALAGRHVHAAQSPRAPPAIA